jgi:hypothetical protein
MFDLDEMKTKWAEHDQKLDESIRLNWQLMKAANLNGARSALQRMSRFLVLEALVWFAIVMALGSFIHGHIAMLRFALPGGALDLFAISMLAATIRQIVAARQINYGQPIVAIQKQVESMRVHRIRMIQWGVLAGALVWAPFAIVTAKVLFGISSYNAAWLWANVVFGLALIPLTFWLSKKFGDRMGRSPFIQRLMKDIAGDNLSAAGAFVARLSEFEDEKGAT